MAAKCLFQLMIPGSLYFQISPPASRIAASTDGSGPGQFSLAPTCLDGQAALAPDGLRADKLNGGGQGADKR